MWEPWLFWILIGGLILFMFRRGGCGGHAGHGRSRDPGDGDGRVGSGNEEKGSDTTPKSAHGGCH